MTFDKLGSDWPGDSPKPPLLEAMKTEPERVLPPLSDPAAEFDELGMPRAEAKEYSDETDKRFPSISENEVREIRAGSGRCCWAIRSGELLEWILGVLSLSSMADSSRRGESPIQGSDRLEWRRSRKGERGFLSGFGGGGIDKLAGTTVASVVPTGSACRLLKLLMLLDSDEERTWECDRERAPETRGALDSPRLEFLGSILRPV